MSGFSEITSLSEIIFDGEVLFTSYGLQYKDFYKTIAPNNIVNQGHTFLFHGVNYRVSEIRVELKENLSSIHSLVQVIQLYVEKNNK